MSRSRRHTPTRGFSTSDSEKEDKRIANRKLRRKVRVVMHVDTEGELPARREVSNPWCMDKDGKRRFDPARDPKHMCK